jgi:hypothetical protein
MSQEDPIELNGKWWFYDARTRTHKPADGQPKRAKRDRDRTAVPATVAQRDKRNALSKARQGCAISSRVDIEIYSYRVHTADTDAPYLKPSLDGIVDCGVIADDSAKEVRSVRFWAAEKAESEAEQKTRIVIRVVEN